MKTLLESRVREIEVWADKTVNVSNALWMGGVMMNQKLKFKFSRDGPAPLSVSFVPMSKGH